MDWTFGDTAETDTAPIPNMYEILTVILNIKKFLMFVVIRH